VKREVVHWKNGRRNFDVQWDEGLSEVACNKYEWRAEIMSSGNSECKIAEQIISAVNTPVLSRSTVALPV
jgi:hypothetical protein